MKDNEKIIYEGVFLDKDEILTLANAYGKRLDKIIENPHITTRYMPIFTMEKLYGTECDVIITAHGNDGKHEGFQVIAVSGNSVVNSMIGQVEHPHVTISVADGEKPVDTVDLIKRGKMKKCKSIFKVRGVFGAYTSGREVIAGI